MSHSPSKKEAAQPSATEMTTGLDDYALGWRALNKLLRRGFSWSGRERNCAFLQTEGDRFADVSAVSGLDADTDGRAAARVDWDRDGDLDLLLTARNGPRVRFLENRTDGARSLSILLRGAGANSGAVGARLELTTSSGRTLVRSVRAGEGYLAQSSPWTVFGLGDDDPRELRVRWPDGRRSVHADWTVGGRYVWEQGEEPELSPQSATVVLPDVPPLSEGALSSAAVVAPIVPVPMPPLPLLSPSGREARLFALGQNGARRTTGRPLLIVLWASWCAPCVTELSALAEGAAKLKELGVDVLALSADAPGDRAAAQRILEGLAWPHSRGFATPRAVDVLDVLQGRLLGRETRIQLPTSFLVDTEGALTQLILGPVSVETVEDALGWIGLEPAARRDRAAPFPGRWRTPVPEFDSLAWADAFETRGFPEVAQAYAFEEAEMRQVSRAEMVYRFARRKAETGDLVEAIRLFNEVLAEEPGHFQARADLGTALHRKGELTAAVAAYEKALVVRPTDGPTLFNLGLAYSAQGNTQEARTVLARLSEVDSAQAEVLERVVSQAEEGNGE